MDQLIRFARRMVLHWQIRSLAQQTACIVDARRHALDRLKEIRRERRIKQKALMMCKSPRTRDIEDEECIEPAETGETPETVLQ